MKTILNTVLSHSAFNYLFSRLVGGYIPIFTLHRAVPLSGAFNGVSPEFLEVCLKYAKKKGYAFASIDELVSLALQGGKIDRPTLCFTLDDGYTDQLHQLVPVFLHYQAKPTFYVVTDLVDGKDWPWDAKLAYCIWCSQAKIKSFCFEGQSVAVDLTCPANKIDTRRRLIGWAKKLTAQQQDAFLFEVGKQFGVHVTAVAPEDYTGATWQDLRDYEQKGLRIGCHGKNHRTFNSLTDDVIAADLQAANNRLLAECKYPSQVFCYPSGTALDFSERHYDVVKRVGFSGAVSTRPRITTLNRIQQCPYAISRLSMPNTLETFKRNCSWFDYLRG